VCRIKFRVLRVVPYYLQHVSKIKEGERERERLKKGQGERRNEDAIKGVETRKRDTRMRETRRRMAWKRDKENIDMKKRDTRGEKQGGD
jgi:hypothetical protein